MTPWDPTAVAGHHLRRVASVQGLGARRALWGEALGTLPPEAGARLVEGAVRGAAGRSPQAVAAFLPLLDLPALSAAATPGRLAAVLEAARAEGCDGCLLLLEYPGRPSAPARPGSPPDPILDTLTLGHRKAAARGLRTPALERILADPDPRVVREVLRNPRLRESEVVAVAVRRPCPAEVFWLLAGSERWVRRAGVQRAAARNPYCPPQLAIGLTVLLADPDRRAVAEQEGLHPAVRDGALRVLGWRRRA